MLRVLTTGTFALPGANHLALFRAIKEMWPGCTLIVGLNSDRRCRELKWYAVLDLRERMAIIGACRDVDEVVSFDEDTPAELIRGLKPDIFCKGGDWQQFAEELPEAVTCREVGAQVEFVNTECPTHASDIAETIGRVYQRRYLLLPAALAEDVGLQATD